MVMRYAIAFCAMFWIWLAIKLSPYFLAAHALTAKELAQSN